MQTTGTVLLNGRCVNINGYPCFVNLSKDMSNYKTNPFQKDYGDRESALPLITEITSNQSSPCSSYSLHTSNMDWNSFTFPDITVPKNRLMTACLWYKWVPISGYATNLCGGVEAFYDMGYWWNHNNTNYYYMRPSHSENWSSYVFNLDNNWHHWAMVKSSNAFYLFIDGVKVHTRNTSNDIFVGFGFRDKRCHVYVDDLVYLYDQALWTSNFTPPSTYLLDSEYAMDLDQVKRRNIILSNVDKKLIIPDEETLKQY